jgi:hypothetical protein
VEVRMDVLIDYYWMNGWITFSRISQEILTPMHTPEFFAGVEYDLSTKYLLLQNASFQDGSENEFQLKRRF